MRIKKECLKLFKVADVSLSLKRWLSLKGRKSCANVKNAEGCAWTVSMADVCSYDLTYMSYTSPRHVNNFRIEI